MSLYLQLLLRVHEVISGHAYCMCTSMQMCVCFNIWPSDASIIFDSIHGGGSGGWKWIMNVGRRTCHYVLNNILAPAITHTHTHTHNRKSRSLYKMTVYCLKQTWTNTLRWSLLPRGKGDVSKAVWSGLKPWRAFEKDTLFEVGKKFVCVCEHIQQTDRVKA